MTVSLNVEQAQKCKNGYDGRYLRDVVEAVVKAKRVLCLTGAGISTSAGIPDFRSKNGLYELAASGSGSNVASSSSTKKTSSSSTSSSGSSSSGSKLSGQDMFSASVWQTPESTQRFLRFISTLHNVSQAAQPTPTHTFLKTLKNKKKLLRCYTQNIDGLEERAGLQAVSSTSSSASSSSSKGKGKSKVKFEGDVVHLHGKAGSVRCTVCPTTGQWTDEIDQAFSNGESVPCDECRGRWEHRYNTGRRTNVAVGGMRPDVTLYGEQGRDDIMISELQDADVKAKPDCLIVMGTSLKVHGFKNLVKDFAGEVAEHDGKVIYVNLTPANKEWENHFDYHIEATTDAFVTYLTAEWKKLRPQDWQTQTLITSSRSLTSTKTSSTVTSSKSAKATKSIDSALPKKPLAVKDINLLASQAFKAQAVDIKVSAKRPRAASPTDSEATLVDEYEKGNKLEDIDATLDSLSAITDSSTLGPLYNSIKSSPDPPTPPKGFFSSVSKSTSSTTTTKRDITIPTSPRKAIANARKRKLAIAALHFDSEGYTTSVQEQQDEEEDSDDNTVTVVSTMSTPTRKRNKMVELSPRKTRSSGTTAKKRALQAVIAPKEEPSTKKRVSLRDSTLKRGVIQSKMIQAQREKEENKLRVMQQMIEAKEKEREKKETARRNINEFMMQKKQKVETTTTGSETTSILRKSRHVRTPSLEV